MLPELKLTGPKQKKKKKKKNHGAPKYHNCENLPQTYLLRHHSSKKLIRNGNNTSYYRLLLWLWSESRPSHNFFFLQRTSRCVTKLKDNNKIISFIQTQYFIIYFNLLPTSFCRQTIIRPSLQEMPNSVTCSAYKFDRFQTTALHHVLRRRSNQEAHVEVKCRRHLTCIKSYG